MLRGNCVPVAGTGRPHGASPCSAPPLHPAPWAPGRDKARASEQASGNRSPPDRRTVALSPLVSVAAPGERGRGSGRDRDSGRGRVQARSYVQKEGCLQTSGRAQAPGRVRAIALEPEEGRVQAAGASAWRPPPGRSFCARPNTHRYKGRAPRASLQHALRTPTPISPSSIVNRRLHLPWTPTAPVCRVRDSWPAFKTGVSGRARQAFWPLL